jgi:hypothetical protein
VFLVRAAVTSNLLPIAATLRGRTTLINGAILVAYAMLIRIDSVHPRLVTGVVRDWVPLALIFLAYREVGWFALPHPTHALELRWLSWDQAFLLGGAKAAIESLGPVLPGIFWHIRNCVRVTLCFGAVLCRGALSFRAA